MPNHVRRSPATRGATTPRAGTTAISAARGARGCRRRGNASELQIWARTGHVEVTLDVTELLGLHPQQTVPVGVAIPVPAVGVVGAEVVGPVLVGSRSGNKGCSIQLRHPSKQCAARAACSTLIREMTKCSARSKWVVSSCRCHCSSLA